MNNFLVKRGDSVLAQQKIGEMGRSGNSRSDKKSSKIHLHFEARKNNKPFNPNNYFKDYKKIGIDDTLYSFISEIDNKRDSIYSFIPETFAVSSLAVENEKHPERTNLKDYYEIQIEASLNHLSKNKIKNFEKMYGCSVKENKINGMYKYSIKKFSSLEEALGFRNSLNSKNNLGILVYKNDKVFETKWKF